jgi:hypothetical protein
MRRAFLTLALALPLLSACASGGGLRPRYDAAAGTTGVSQPIFETASEQFRMRMTADYNWRGQGAPTPAQAGYLNFTAWPRTAAGRQWQSNNQLRVVVDGQRATYNGRYDSQSGEGAYENMLYQIPITDLTVMSEATRIEGRIGTREFVLGPQELARLREFVAYVAGGGR